MQRRYCWKARQDTLTAMDRWIRAVYEADENGDKPLGGTRLKEPVTERYVRSFLTSHAAIERSHQMKGKTMKYRALLRRLERKIPSALPQVIHVRWVTSTPEDRTGPASTPRRQAGDLNETEPGECQPRK
jgi:hypothetical protein